MDLRLVGKLAGVHQKRIAMLCYVHEIYSGGGGGGGGVSKCRVFNYSETGMNVTSIDLV